MSKRFTELFRILLVLALVFGFNANDLDAAKRRLFVENHTGTWCGWCTLGKQAIKDLNQEFGDDVVTVEIHNGDAMTYQEFERPLNQLVRITGHPQGSVSRLRFNSGGQQVTAVAPTNYVGIARQLSTLEAPLDVVVDASISRSGVVSAKVTAKVEQNLQGEYAFNLFVVEDGLTGTGSQWSQRNFLSGNTQYQSHPYFSQPDPIVGYVHNNVVIAVVGGIRGENAKFPTNALTAGVDYSHEFLVDLSDRIRNYRNVRVVGIVMQTGSTGMEIINVKMEKNLVEKQTSDLIVNVEGTNYERHTSGQPKPKKITVRNPNNFEVTVDAIVNAVGTGEPESWGSRFSESTFTLAPNAEKEIEWIINANGSAQAGYGGYSLNIQSRSTATHIGKIVPVNLHSIASSSKYLVLFASNNYEPVAQALAQMIPVYSQSAIMGFNANVLNAYPMADFDLTVVHTDMERRGIIAGIAGDEPSATLARSIQQALQSGKKVLINGIIESFLATGTVPNFSPHPAAATMFRSVIGVETFDPAGPIGVAQQTQQGITLSIVQVNSNTNDEFFPAMQFNVNDFNAQSHPYYSYWLDRFKVLNNSTTVPFLWYNIQGQPENARIAGVRTTLANGGKAILTGFGFDLIGNMAQRALLTQRSIEWLLDGDMPDLPVIALSTNKIDFGNVKMETEAEREFTISNNGVADLEITDISLGFGDAGFTIADVNVPFTLAPNETKTIKVLFTPTVEDFAIENIEIISNDPENGFVYVDLEGTGVAADVELGPQISVNTNTLTFGEVKTNETEDLTFELGNTGDQPLVISSMNFDKGDAGYTIVEMPSLPLTIDQGQKVTIQVRFAPPSVGVLTDAIIINSNDEENASVTVALNGTGANPGSVRNGVAGDESIFTMEVHPNPVQSVSQFRYVVAGNASRNVNVYVINSAGVRVADLVNSNVAPGEHSLNFEANTLPSGSYYIIANIGEYSTQLPINVIR